MVEPPDGDEAEALGWRCAAYHSARAALQRASAAARAEEPTRELSASPQGSSYAQRYAAERVQLLRRAAGARVAAGSGRLQWPPPPAVGAPPLEPSPQRRPSRRRVASDTATGSADSRRKPGSGDGDGGLIPAGGRTGARARSYLCESALRDFLRYGAGGVAANSTARCSTITQDMDLDSLSDDTQSQGEVDWEETAEAGGGGARSDDDIAFDDSWTLVPTPVERGDVSGKEGPEDAQIGDDLPVDVSYRVTHRFGDPEGLGPSAGRITALRHCASAPGLLAAGTDRGHIYLLREGPEAVAERVGGHSAQVMDVEWSNNGQYLLSVGLDGVTRIWTGWSSRSTTASPRRPATRARCVREIADAALMGLAVRFTPRNNNIFAVAGAAPGYAPAIKFYNLSTGKVVRGQKLKFAVWYFAWSHSGDCMFTADAGGCVTAYSYDFMTQTAKKSCTAVLVRGHQVTSLSFLPPPSRADREEGSQRALLLANTMASAVFILGVHQGTPMRLTILRKVALPQRHAILRSAFCPLPGVPAAFATGSEDGSVWLLRPGRGKSEPLLKLQGHQGAVLNVSVDGQGGIASGDELGCVMLWRRAGAEEAGGDVDAGDGDVAAIETTPCPPVAAAWRGSDSATTDTSTA
eukprot:TRINITY_DN24399_c0_g1_i1.p1 TRINITY_DN24399_c0_g1~~TRINITY_DN24399_c0_g1_i1.p1  ORF type:complete len:655 (+),score=234.99 TRINITY_DN24399_c0_g1_i1:58-1965(+)